MENERIETDATDANGNIESLFDEFFKRRPVSEGSVNKGRLENLRAFEQQHFHTLYQPNVLAGTKAQINARLEKYGKLIQPPHGPVTIHLNFVDSTISNGMTFVHDGIYFVGITSQMLLDFEKACVALAGRAAVRDLLAVPISPEAVQALCTAFLVLQLQFIVFHEIGHIFHAHRDACAFREEYRLTSMDKLLLLYPDQDLAQAKEWLADRYAVRMLLQDLISTGSGANMHRMIRSMLPQDECFLWLIVLAIGSVFFFGPSERFHLPLVRKRDHPADLARMNIVLRSIVEWGQASLRPDIEVWASSTKNFEWVTACIQDAAQSDDRRDDWIAQGEYLRSDAGRDYLDVLYKRDGVVTPEMVESWWKV